MQLLPSKLTSGDTIGLVSPSKPLGKFQLDQIDQAVDYFTSLGLQVKFADNARAVDKFGYAGGTPEQRAHDIHQLFSDDAVQAVWATQGGNTANQVLDHLDFDLIRSNPKLFIGKSNIDLLLLAIQKKTGLITFHGPDPKIGNGGELGWEYTQKWFVERLMKGTTGKVASTSDRTVHRPGKTSGKVVGCNLSSLLMLAGTDYFPDFSDSILFLEAYHYYAARTIHQLTQLKQLGVFDKINGLVIGYIFGSQDEEAQKKNPQTDPQGNKIAFEEVVMDITKEYEFPVMKINEFGHRCPHLFLPIGGQVELDTEQKRLAIIEPCVK